MLWMLVCKVEELPTPGGPRPEPAKEEIGDFYVRLGMAIAAWQHVESSLFSIYQCCFDPHRSLASSMASLNAAFHQPAGFRTRLDMTNTAFECSPFDGAIKGDWGKLYTRALRRSQRRNALTHAVVCFQPYERPPGQQLFLSTGISKMATRQHAFDAEHTITQKELDEMRISFEQLEDAFSEFFGRLVAALPTAYP